jgi:putative hydrolase of the HAD superfamily
MYDTGMVEAVLFDYGMVLSGPADPAAWARMVAIAGVDEERFRAAYWAPRHAYDRGTHDGLEYWLTAGRHAGVEFTGAQVRALIDEDTELWTQVNQPMVDWAARLQAAGTRTGILSNLGDAMTAGVLAQLPWMVAFHFKLFSHSVKLAKPELEIYAKAIEGLGVPAERILFVDDRADNCEAGRAAGLQVIQYLDHGEFVAEMERRGLGELWHTGALRAT